MNSDRIDARRAQLATDLRAEGSSEEAVARLATDETAIRMVSYEDKCVSHIISLFGPKP